jgi:hypothetical protein
MAKLCRNFNCVAVVVYYDAFRKAFWPISTPAIPPRIWPLGMLPWESGSGRGSVLSCSLLADQPRLMHRVAAAGGRASFPEARAQSMNGAAIGTKWPLP